MSLPPRWRQEFQSETPRGAQEPALFPWARQPRRWAVGCPSTYARDRPAASVGQDEACWDQHSVALCTPCGGPGGALLGLRSPIPVVTVLHVCISSQPPPCLPSRVSALSPERQLRRPFCGGGTLGDTFSRARSLSSRKPHPLQRPWARKPA